MKKTFMLFLFAMVGATCNARQTSATACQAKPFSSGATSVYIYRYQSCPGRNDDNCEAAEREYSVYVNIDFEGSSGRFRAAASSQTRGGSLWYEYALDGTNMRVLLTSGEEKDQMLGELYIDHQLVEANLSCTYYPSPDVDTDT